MLVDDVLATGGTAAAAVNLLRNWVSDPTVTAAVGRMSKDTNELVRAMVARALEQPAQQGDPAANGTLQLLLRRDALLP